MREHRPGGWGRLPRSLPAGALDAVCFPALGEVSASVITGNLVQLGLGLAGSEAEAAP